MLSRRQFLEAGTVAAGIAAVSNPLRASDAVRNETVQHLSSAAVFSTLAIAKK